MMWVFSFSDLSVFFPRITLKVVILVALIYFVHGLKRRIWVRIPDILLILIFFGVILLFKRLSWELF